MHSKNDNIEVMPYDKADEAIEELLSGYQIRLKASIRGSDFIFDSVWLLHYKCQKMNFKCWRSYVDSPDWIKRKKQQ